LSDRLVVEKSARQRRIEGVILFVMPPVVASACRVYLGPGLWQIPIVLLGFVVISFGGNVVALRSGGELMTPAERYRRDLMRMASRPVWSSLFRSFAFWLILTLSMALPMSAGVPQGSLFIFPYSIVGAGVCSGLSVFYRRRVGSKISTTPQPLPRQPPWVWLRAYAPYRIITVATSIGVYLVAHHFSNPNNILILLVGCWLGLVIEVLLRSRKIKNAPLLWHDLGFLQALATAVVQLGIPFAIFFGLVGALTEGRFDIVVGLSAVAGFVGGILFILGFWALAKLNTVKASA
jgi:hypothetical protein